MRGSSSASRSNAGGGDHVMSRGGEQTREDLEGRLVIFDHEQAHQSLVRWTGAGNGSRPTLLAGLLWRRHGGSRQLDGEGGTASQTGAFGADDAAVEIDDGLCDGETQSEAAEAVVVAGDCLLE